MPQPPEIPPFHGDIDFHAHHAAPGAFFTFTLGKFGRRGGFGCEIGRPGDCDVFIGVKDGDRFSDGELRVLPFYEGADASEADRYKVEESGPAAGQPRSGRMRPYAKGEIERRYGWATDRWTTADFSYKIRTEVAVIPDKRADLWSYHNALTPSVLSMLYVDNRAGKQTKTAFFAINFNQPGARAVDLALDEFPAFAWRDRYAFNGIVSRDTDRGEQTEPAVPFRRFQLGEAIASRAVHALGSVQGFLVEVPAGQSAQLSINLMAHVAGEATTGWRARYAYLNAVPDLDTAAGNGFVGTPGSELSDDLHLLESGLSPDQQFLLAHATRSYFGSTQLLDVGGQPLWVVNEGEYCMLNTLDLAVDQMFFELEQNPWVVRNLLDTFADRYSFVDELQAEREKATPTIPGGVSFTHDMGVHNHFTPAGQSSYELEGLTGCFSHMVGEQLCNWSLMAGCYDAIEQDDRWLAKRRPLVKACLESMLNRGGDVGFFQYDSARCAGGSEITTYDSLDHSLAQTRNNLYMAVKAWATYRLLGRLLRRAGDDDATRAFDAAAKVARFVCEQPTDADGVLPAIFESDNPGHKSRILPAAEGLIYPWFCGETIDDFSDDERRMVDVLKTHTRACLADEQKRNLFPDGGIRLSSTSDNSWMSKIFLFQHVANVVLGLKAEFADLMAKADAAHVGWMTNDTNAYWAFSDQIHAGVAKGSLYYPRGVTSILWTMPEPPTSVGENQG